MRKLFAVVLVGIGCGSLLLFSGKAIARSQEHAPTLDVCRADLAVWHDHEEAKDYYDAERLFTRDGTPNRTATNKLSLSEVKLRKAEMFECMRVDLSDQSKYEAAGSFYYDVFADRYINFVRRHGLEQQLRREDADGKR